MPVGTTSAVPAAESALTAGGAAVASPIAGGAKIVASSIAGPGYRRPRPEHQRGFHRGLHAASKPGIADTGDPPIQAVSAWLPGSIWARLDSNQGPTYYESAALTS